KHLQLIIDLEENCPLYQIYEKLKNLPFVKKIYLNTKGFLEIADRKNKYQIAYDSILSVEALGNYVKIVTTENQNYCFACSLKKVFQLLPKDLFLRVHRSYVVNRLFIKSWSKNSIETTNGMSLTLSRRKKVELKVA
ncbi:MAG: LytR/AlgR family response regulator transcription factor, partial [Raineya sp.]